MKSKTKFKIKPDTIKKLFEKAGIKAVTNITPLGAGEYNSVYSVDAGEKAYAIKIAPDTSIKTLTYEKQMMEQEIYYYSLMSDQAKIPVPHIYFHDFSKTDIEAHYFIMEKLPGIQLDKANLSKEHSEEVSSKLAVMVAKLHSVKGKAFGYRQNELHDDWYSALHSMIKNLINDCKGRGHNTRRGKRLLSFVEHFRSILEKVESSLINFDIWLPNFLFHFEDETLNLSWVDPERCLWGDRIADFVCLDFSNMDLNKKLKTLNSYNGAADNPIEIGEEERIRFALMLGYLGLIMEAEKYVRYTVFHFGYWRNIFASNLLYGKCFKQLKKLM